ncbi:MAG: hypothetical protein WCX82_04465 [archaeon]
MKAQILVGIITKTTVSKDKKNRILIPSDIRRSIGFSDFVNLDICGGKIIISRA